MDLYLHALHKVTDLKSTSSFHVLVLEILDSPSFKNIKLATYLIKVLRVFVQHKNERCLQLRNKDGYKCTTVLMSHI